MADSIQWLDWDQATFAQAAARDVPVLLSLVTAWSDECRMMDRETFARPDVAAEVSSRFLAIRVDGDRRPDVNDRYNLGGWPTTAFLTSDGEILSGGTYFDADGLLIVARRVSAAWRDRSDEIRAEARRKRAAQPASTGGVPDTGAVDHFRSLIQERFDPVHGGFGAAPKLPHADVLLLALLLAPDDHGSADPALAAIVDTSLEKITGLWDPHGGGFSRYAEGADWSRPGTEKTLEDNAALLHVHVEATLRSGSSQWRARVEQQVKWVLQELSDEQHGGFYNARSGSLIDRSMYVDRNAAMVSAFLRAAAVLDDAPLRNFAVKSFEAVVLPGYVPGQGVAHIDAAVRGLLTDQVRVASAAVWAHAATEQLPYSMLAVELMRFAIRAMWDSAAGRFRDRLASDDPIWPFQINCEAACVLARLSTLTGDDAFRDRALTILGSLAGDYRSLDLFGAPYSLAIREVVDRKVPAGLELKRVDWRLESAHDG